MAKVPMTPEQHRDLIQLIARHGVNALARQNLLEMAGLGEFLLRISPDTEPQVFAQQAVRVWQDYGTLQATGKPALVNLLIELRGRVQGDEAAATLIDALLAPFEGASPLLDQIRVLFMAANPLKTKALRLDQEARTIKERLREAPQYACIDLETAWAVRYRDISLALLEHKPHIVHFSGHGAESAELVFEDETGTSQYVEPEEVADLFRILKDNIRVVVMNACWSETQARAIAGHIDAVIGMNAPIDDDAAIHFAAGFYRGIGFGRSIADSFDLGHNELAAMTPGNKGIPQIIPDRARAAGIMLRCVRQ